jgi:mono/diheme cytochrome c family protein
MRALMNPLPKPQVIRVLVWTSMAFIVGIAPVRAQNAPNDTNRVGEVKTTAGYKLFDHNCAHCHGDDARGDEGPDLHGLRKSDARLEKIIKEGVKGEMPAFGKKFSDDEVKELVGYLRTLKN